MAWVDPRFRSKKEKPKGIKLNKFGEAPCDIRNVVPRQNPISAINTSRAGVSATSAGQRAGGGGGPCAIRAPSASRPTTARPTIARPTTARPPTAGGRPSSAAPCPPQARPPPLAARPCAEGAPPPQVGVSLRMHQGRYLRPPTEVRQLRPPSQIARPCPSQAPPCPSSPPASSPCRAPSPPPCPASQRSRLAPPQRYGMTSSTPLGNVQRSIQPPSVSGIPSGLRAPGSSSMASSSGAKPKCQKIVLLPGDINPQETTVITVEPPPPQKRREKSSAVRFVKTKSIKPAWVGPCPEPEPEPEPPRPQSTLLSFSPPRTGAPRRLPRFVSRRFGGEPCPQQAPPCPQQAPPCPEPAPPPCPAESDTNFYEEPCPSQEPCPYRPQQQEECPPPPCPEECPPPPCPDECPPDPCPEENQPRPCEQPPPDPNELWYEQMLQGPQQQPCPSQGYTYERGENLLDITPPQDMRGFEFAQEQFPEELIQWEDPQDPWTPPPRAATPPPSQCIDFVGKQDPFSPPKLSEYYARRYPQLRDIQIEPGTHPIFSQRHVERRQAPCPTTQASPCRRSPTVVDREFLAKSVPHNRQVSTLCRDDSDDDDIGLLPDDEFEGSFEQPMITTRQKYNTFARMDAEKLKRNARERLMQLRIQTQLDEDLSNLQARNQRSQHCQEGAEAARRVTEMYSNMYRECEPPPPPPQLHELESNLGDYGDLGACTLEDEIDFEAIEAECID